MRTRCIGQTDRERMISSRTRSFAPSPSSIYDSLEFRRLWDGARDLGDLALEDEAYERSIIGGSDGMLKFVLQKRLPERWGDPPKTINQNLSLRLMSPEQREEEAGRILLRISSYRRWLRGRLGS